MKTLEKIEKLRDSELHSHRGKNCSSGSHFTAFKCRQCNLETGPIHNCTLDGITYHADGF